MYREHRLLVLRLNLLPEQCGLSVKVRRSPRALDQHFGSGPLAPPIGFVDRTPRRMNPRGGSYSRPPPPSFDAWGGAAPRRQRTCAAVDPPTRRRASAISQATSNRGSWHPSMRRPPPRGLVLQLGFPPIPDWQRRSAVILSATRPRLRPSRNASPAAQVLGLLARCEKRRPMGESPRISLCSFPVFSKDGGEEPQALGGGAEPRHSHCCQGYPEALPSDPLCCGPLQHRRQRRGQSSPSGARVWGWMWG